MNHVFDAILHDVDKLKLEGRHQEALELANKHVMTYSNMPELYEEIADNLMAMKEYCRATKALLKALEIDPKSANALYLYGFTLSAQKRYEESVQILEEAYKYSKHPEILRCLGWSMFFAGKRAKGFKMLKESNEMREDKYTLSDMGVCCLHTKCFDNAIKYLKKSLELDYENTETKENLDDARFFKKEFMRTGFIHKPCETCKP